MGVYEDWKQPQLQAEASRRGLSAGGTNAEIAARLEESDQQMAAADRAAVSDDDLLGDDTPTVPAPSDAPAAAPVTPVTAPPPAAEPTPVVAKPKGPFETSFPCSGELSTGMHNEYRERAYAQALAEGLMPRGGLAGVSRTAFRDINGARHAVYQVVLQRQNPARP